MPPITNWPSFEVINLHPSRASYPLRMREKRFENDPLEVSLNKFVLLGFLVMLLTGCATSNASRLPGGSDAYALIPAEAETSRPQDYRIGPLDTLKITVFREPDLSLEEVPVDASGNVLLPLIGQMQASGKTSQELAGDVSSRLASRYLVDPQVLVFVSKSASLVVTVEGQVKKPGVYEVTGQMTLLQAIASAEGPTQIAKLSEVVVFRRTAGQQYAARFNLDQIRDGRAADPKILGNDVVVVGLSSAKSIYRDALVALPALGSLFVAIGQNN
jgi:polysaccharide biosynthesis/export protein